MKYRILELDNGKFKLQYKTLFFWIDSCASDRETLKEAKELARFLMTIAIKNKVIKIHEVK